MRPVNANANAYRNDSSKSNTYAKLTWVTYAYTHGDCHSYCSAQGNTKASSDSASSAVSA